MVQDLGFAHPLGEATEYQGDWDAGSSDVCLPVQDLGVDGDELELLVRHEGGSTPLRSSLRFPDFILSSMNMAEPSMMCHAVL